MNAVHAGYVLAFGLAAAACLYGALRVRSFDGPAVRRGLLALLSLSGVWAAVTVAQLLATTLAVKAAWYTVGLVVGFATVPAWLYFASAYAGRSFHRDRRLGAAAAAVVAVAALLKATNPVHGAYFGAELARTPFPHLELVRLWPHWTATGVAYAGAAVGFYVLFDTFRTARVDTTALSALTGLAGVPVVPDLVSTLRPDLLVPITYEPLGVAAFAVGTVTLARQDFLAVQAVGRGRSVAAAEHPVVVADDCGRVVDANRRAESLFDRLGAAGGDARGQGEAVDGSGRPDGGARGGDAGGGWAGPTGRQVRADGRGAAGAVTLGDLSPALARAAGTGPGGTGRSGDAGGRTRGGPVGPGAGGGDGADEGDGDRGADDGGGGRTQVLTVAEDGRLGEYLVRATPVEVGPNTVGYTVSLVDVTDLRHDRRVIDRQAEQFEEITAAMHHHLRNELTIAEGYADYLDRRLRAADDAALDPALRSELLEAVGELLDAQSAMTDSVEHLATLVEQSKPVAATSVRSLAATARAGFERVDPDGLELTVETGSRVDADHARLTRLFVHAFEAARLGGADRVTVRPRGDGFAVVHDGDLPELSSFESSIEFGDTTAAGFHLAFVRTLAHAHGWTTVTGSDGDRCRILVGGVRTVPGDPGDAAAPGAPSPAVDDGPGPAGARPDGGDGRDGGG